MTDLTCYACIDWYLLPEGDGITGICDCPPSPFFRQTRTALDEPCDWLTTEDDILDAVHQEATQQPKTN